jgi:RimJ/RimL family protein N-acetyltransferase
MTLTGDPFGFGEIIPQKDNVPRLGRLLIGDVALRGKGLGKKLVQLLIDECRKNFNTNTIELYVLSDNIPAIRCYKALGFNFITGDETNILLGDVPKVMKKMRLVLL